MTPTDLLFDIENQAATNYCVRFSATTYLEAIWRKFDPDHAKEFSVAFLVWVTNEARGRPGNANEGLDAGTLMQCLKQYGCCTEATWPSTPENYARKPSPAAYAEAKQYRIGKWASVQTPAEARPYLAKGLPVLVRVDLPDGFTTIKGPRDTHPAQWAKLGKGKLGQGHMMAAIDDAGVAVGLDIVNSWGTAWGDGGITRISDASLEDMNFRGYAITGLKWQWLKTAKKWFKGMFK